MTETDRRSKDKSPPIAFRVRRSALHEQGAPDTNGAVNIRTRTRSLSGMQKEALVEYGPTGTFWRLLCDEGPWLNGTDLAPFPLGYFAAGLTACLMSDILAEACERDVSLEALKLRVDNFFTMEGSIVKGTMAAGVDPIQLAVDGGEAVDAVDLRAVVDSALRERSAVYSALTQHLPGRFSLIVNGHSVAWPGNAAGKLTGTPDPAPAFDGLRPTRRHEASEPLVRKDTNTTNSAGQGAVGLQAEQKRTVHLRSDAVLRSDGLKEIAVQCLQPSGSRFVLLSDDATEAGGQARAPCGFSYLSAGIAFCFMTQLGRYAQIKKLELRDYRVVQDTCFRRAGSGGPGASPVETLVWLDSDDSDENNLRMVKMGEQTCYLHTTFREPVEISVVIGPGARETLTGAAAPGDRR